MKKKVSYITMLGLVVLLLTGCGTTKIADKGSSKKVKILECSEVEEEEGMTSTINTKFEYDTNKKEFISGSASMIMEVPEEVIDYFEELDLCESFVEKIGDEYKNCKSSIDKNKINFSFEVDVDKLAEEEEDFSIDMDIETAKAEMEEDGATCTIK